MMAQLFPSSSAAQPRISQVLPTVKCSSCNAPVPLTELGDHICEKPPPLPTGSITNRLQNIVTSRLPSSRTATPPKSISIPKTTINRTDSPSVPPQRSPNSSLPKTSSPLASPRLNNAPLSPLMSPTQLPFSNGKVKVRAGSVASTASMPTSARQPSPLSRDRERTESISSMSSSHSRSQQQVRARQPSILPPPTSRLPEPPVSRTPPPVSRTPQPRTPFGPSPSVIPPPSRTPQSISISRPPQSPQSVRTLQPPPAPRTPQPHLSMTPSIMEEPATHTGGEAGMAGVGRRGFAAAARAALFSQSMNPNPFDPSPMSIRTRTPSFDRQQTPTPAFRERKPSVDTITISPEQRIRSPRYPNAPHSLDISAALQPAPSSSTPPLSASSSSAMSHPSPISPPSPTAQFYNRDRKVDLERTPTDSTTYTYTSRKLGLRSEKPPISDEDEDEDGAESEIGLAYAESEPSVYEDTDAGSGDESSEKKGRKDPPPPLSLQRGNSARIAHALGLKEGTSGKLGAPPARSSKSSNSTAAPLRISHSSAGSRATDYFSLQKRFDQEEEDHGRLEKAMGNLLEETFGGPRTSISRAQRSNTVQPRSPEAMGVRLPARSRTERNSSRKSADRAPRLPKIKICVRCEKHIDDGRWVQVEKGTREEKVLCEKCWKNMYLPKCRRCHLPIEKQAVSSSDGQLKGKYHKECFSCFKCSEPFPDKSFYIFDSQPFCKYHYHQANGSLCLGCDEGIEGECAVDADDGRWHKQCFKCEYDGCKERLEDYWEVDGMKLCENHAGARSVDEDDDEFDDLLGGMSSLDHSTKAQKRMTRFIDL